MTIRNGDQYLAGLDDGREVWVAGERVTDVAHHPALSRSAASIARLFDLQHEEAHQQSLTYLDSENGQLTPISFRPPRTAEDLVARRRAVKTMADATAGHVGRSPDFMAIAVTAFATASDIFASCQPQFGENIRRFYQYCRDNDVYISHATINPQVNRAADLAAQASSAHLRVTSQDTHGITLNGTKMIGTLTPLADELLVYPLPRYADGDEAYTAAFAVPVGTPGLRLLCREPFGGDNMRNAFDHPLTMLDEIDATCVFDDVKVPWDRVFWLGEVEKANQLYDLTTARNHTGHHGLTRGVAKIEFMVGVALALARSARTDTFLHVQEMLGEVIGLVELARGGVLQAEAGAAMSAWDTLTPAMGPIHALRYHFPVMVSRVAEVIQTLGGGSLMSAPTQADLQSPIGDMLRRSFSGSADLDPDQRINLLKLAWDASGDGSGQRQLLYERYHSGDPVRLAALQYKTYDTSAFDNAVDRVLTLARSTSSVPA